MLHYLALSLSTLTIFFLLWKIWKRTNDLSFVIGIMLIYYWSLAGSWLLVYDQLNGAKGEDWGLHYYYLFRKMFPVSIDETYLETIGLYSLFIIGTELTILYFAKNRTTAIIPAQPLHIFHGRLIPLCIAAMTVSCVLVFKEILIATKFDLSVYTVTRAQPSRFNSLHQLSNQLAIVPLYLGLFTFLCGKSSKYISGSHNRWYLAGYIAAIFLVELYLMFLGNKREIMFAGIIGLVFYLNNTGYKPKIWALGLFVVIVVTPLLFNDVLRGFSPKGLLAFFDTTGLTYDTGKATKGFSMGDAASSLLFSNEMFCANFSMYGALIFDVPLTYGSSLLSLAASVVPKFLWASRPEDIYSYYAASVNAIPGQGYTIHHATAWYLNFGIAGVIIGALCLGGVWVWLYNKFMKFDAGRKRFIAILCILATGGIAGQMPAIIRSGPEAYKVLFIEGLLLPSLALFIATVRLRKKAGDRS
jgi:hypothetical protein